MKGQYFGQLCAVKSWSFDKSSYACKGWIEYFLYGTLCAGAGGRRQGSTVRYSDSHDWVVSMAHTGGRGRGGDSVARVPQRVPASSSLLSSLTSQTGSHSWWCRRLRSPPLQDPRSPSPATTTTIRSHLSPLTTLSSLFSTV